MSEIYSLYDALISAEASGNVKLANAINRRINRLCRRTRQ